MDVSDQLDRLCYDYIEGDEPVVEEDLTWLIDTVDRLTRWLDRMPSRTYPEESPLWKQWALTAPLLPVARARTVA